MIILALAEALSVCALFYNCSVFLPIINIIIIMIEIIMIIMTLIKFEKRSFGGKYRITGKFHSKTTIFATTSYWKNFAVKEKLLIALFPQFVDFRLFISWEDKENGQKKVVLKCLLFHFPEIFFYRKITSNIILKGKKGGEEFSTWLQKRTNIKMISPFFISIFSNNKIC